MKIQKVLQAGCSIVLFSATVFLYSSIVHAAPGDVDLSFNAGVISSQFQQDRLTAIAVQPDGKILIGGLFNVVAGVSRNGLARLNADGSVDTAFVPPPFSQGDLVNPYKIAVQPDGKIIIAGNNFRIGNSVYQIIRLNSDGSLDASFSLLAIDAFRGIEGLALQTDGKILIGGDFGSVGGVERRIAARLNSNGTLDTSFSIGLTPTMYGGRATGFAIQSDGKIIAGGSLFVTVGSTTFANVVRLDANGAPDTSFFVAGDSLDAVHALILQTDGKVIIAGDGSANTGSRKSLSRVNADGSIDASFNSTVSTGGQVYSIVLEPTGKVIAVGNFCTSPVGQGCGIARFNPNGSRDVFYPFNAACGTQGFDNDTLAVVRQPDGKILVGGRFSNVSCFPRQRIIRLQNTSKTVADFDGDGKTDISIFRPAPGEWWYQKSSNGGNSAAQFGSSTDKIVPADYTGDGKTDFAFFRPSSGQWFVLRSEDFSFYAFPFGVETDVPVPADYDGDGKTDAAVFRPSTLTWFINKSSGGTEIIGFGSAGDKPVVGDYDGDGKADIAIFRPNGAEWWIRRSSNSSVFALQFGISTDKPTQGDFTGDGKTDVAIWRPSNGNWFILRSEDFSFFAFPFGANGDVPVPGDYDGDGKFDAAVFRPTNQTWFVNRSTGGTLIQQFGIPGDFPLPNAFVP